MWIATVCIMRLYGCTLHICVYMCLQCIVCICVMLLNKNEFDSCKLYSMIFFSLSLFLSPSQSNLRADTHTQTFSATEFQSKTMLKFTITNFKLFSCSIHLIRIRMRTEKNSSFCSLFFEKAERKQEEVKKFNKYLSFLLNKCQISHDKSI